MVRKVVPVLILVTVAAGMFSLGPHQCPGVVVSQAEASTAMGSCYLHNTLTETICVSGVCGTATKNKIHYALYGLKLQWFVCDDDARCIYQDYSRDTPSCTGS